MKSNKCLKLLSLIATITVVIGVPLTAHAYSTPRGCCANRLAYVNEYTDSENPYFETDSEYYRYGCGNYQYHPHSYGLCPYNINIISE